VNRTHAPWLHDGAAWKARPAWFRSFTFCNTHQPRIPRLYRYNRLSNRFDNRFDNGFDNSLYRVNGAEERRGDKTRMHTRRTLIQSVTDGISRRDARGWHCTNFILADHAIKASEEWGLLLYRDAVTKAPAQISSQFFVFQQGRCSCAHGVWRNQLCYLQYRPNVTGYCRFSEFFQIERFSGKLLTKSPFKPITVITP